MSRTHMMADVELERGPIPCPFCGETPDHFVQNQGDKWVHVACCCGGPEVRTGYSTDPAEWAQDAVDEWNRRAPQDKASLDTREPEDDCGDRFDHLVRCMTSYLADPRSEDRPLPLARCEVRVLYERLGGPPEGRGTEGDGHE